MAATSQPNVPSETEILAGLDKIRLRRLIAFGPFSVFFCGSALFFALSYLSPEFCQRGLEVGIFQLLLAPFAFGSFIILFVSVVGMKCPRCNKYFHAGPRYRSDFTGKCLNSGLRLNGSNASEPF